MDHIIVSGIGAGTNNKLNEMGIKVYKASKGSVQDNIALFELQALPEMTLQQTCGGHIGLFLASDNAVAMK